MPRLAGWTYEKVLDVDNSIMSKAQVWNGTKEAYFCKSNPYTGASPLGPLGVSVAAN